MRSKISTNRYSIAGYPSLYLGTSLELCCDEIHAIPNQDSIIAAGFKLNRRIEFAQTNIQVIELGVKPQDFGHHPPKNGDRGRRIPTNLVSDKGVKESYLLWYPLIAACSFVRRKKEDPFAVEYIIPQLLMQWARSQISPPNNNEYGKLIGIRYFSCASTEASDMGFNYVFPTCGRPKSFDFPYCDVLMKSFWLTKPVRVLEYDSISACERKLAHSEDYDYCDVM